MNISSIVRTYEAQIYEKTQAGAKTGKKEQRKDTVALSDEGKDFQAVLKALSKEPDVREDKVKAIKDKIDAGQYNIKTEAIANKILQGGLSI